jgi:HSP20 family molecular chaperone IbpA
MPLRQEVDSAYDPLENFNILTKSMREISKFADQIASPMTDPSHESLDHKPNDTGFATRIGRLCHQGKNFELKLRPRIDWQETREGFFLTAATPGLRKEDVSIEIAEHSGNSFLEISGHTVTKSEDSPKPLTLHASYPSFNHKVRLPAGVDRGSLKANYENGLLIVTMQHSEQPMSQRHKITIA